MKLSEGSRILGMKRSLQRYVARAKEMTDAEREAMLKEQLERIAQKDTLGTFLKSFSFTKL